MRNRHRLPRLLPLFLGLLAATPAAGERFHVSLRAGVYAGERGSLVLVYTTHGDSALNAIQVLDFTTEGNIVSVETSGRVYTGITPGYGVQADSSSLFAGPYLDLEGIPRRDFYNRLELGYQPLGPASAFDVSWSEAYPSPPRIPDGFAVYLSRINGLYQVDTEDSLGVDALFNLTLEPGSFHLETFAPMQFIPPDSLVLDLTSQTGVDDERPLPGRIRILAAGPNPFREAVRLDFEVPAGTGAVEARVFDSQGRLIRALPVPETGSGARTLVWSGDTDRGGRAAPGVYFLVLQSGKAAAIRKLTRVR